MSENVEGQLAGNPFVGELSARMVGGRAGAGSAARMERRLEALRGVREKAARSAGGAGELVSLYEELCDADHLE